MIYFSIYNKITGEIVNAGSVSNQKLYDVQVVPEGYIKVPVESDPFTQYFENDVVVAIPTKPTYACDFNFTTKQWVLNYDELAARIIGHRNWLLSSSDWTQTALDAPITNRDAWAQYRQALRDITTQSGYPVNVVWPTPPQ